MVLIISWGKLCHRVGEHVRKWSCGWSIFSVKSHPWLQIQMSLLFRQLYFTIVVKTQRISQVHKSQGLLLVRHPIAYSNTQGRHESKSPFLCLFPSLGLSPWCGAISRHLPPTSTFCTSEYLD